MVPDSISDSECVAAYRGIRPCVKEQITSNRNLAQDISFSAAFQHVGIPILFACGLRRMNESAAAV